VRDMQKEAFSSPLFTLAAYLLFFLSVISLFLAVILIVKEAVNTFYTHEMAPGDYLISGAVYLVAGLILLGGAYYLRPSILRRKAESEKEEELREVKPPTESLDDLL